jgi:hypothetical protein
MAISALRARMGVGASRMVVNAVGAAGRTTGNNTNSFRRTLKAVDNSSSIGSFSKIRRFSDIAGYRLPEKITADTTRFGEYCLALYFGGIAVPGGILYGLIYISERRDRRERLRNRRYDDDVQHDDVLQFGDKYVDAMEIQGQLLSQWQAADDRKLRQLEAEVAKLCEVMGKFDFREEIADLRQELLKAGTAAEVLEIRKRYDDLVEKINLLASQWRAVADLQLAEFNRDIMEVRRRIQEVERKQEEL